jgi:folate-dependent phosphoribosylglycinamide formyltransferase PurN
MNKPLFDPQKGKMKVAGLLSGSGKSLIAIINRQKELEKQGECNFEVVGLFSDNPKSQAEAIGTSNNLPFFINDIRAFYRSKGAKLNNLEIRGEFDRQTVEFLKPLQPDVVVYAGYVWATVEPLVSAFMGINCHPADLRVVRDGRRAYAGANGVADALLAGESKLHSKLHIVSPVIDPGPILLVSTPVTVMDNDNMSFQDKMRYHLRLLNEHSRKLFALAIEEISRGHFLMASNGQIIYNEKPIPEGFQL